MSSIEDYNEAERLIQPHFAKGWGAQLAVGYGWGKLLIEAHNIAMSYDPDYVVHQVKEKFGGLRFYSNLPADAEILIEALAIDVCEVCGAPGTMTTTGWMRCLCEEHHNERL